MKRYNIRDLFLIDFNSFEVHPDIIVQNRDYLTHNLNNFRATVELKLKMEGEVDESDK